MKISKIYFIRFKFLENFRTLWSIMAKNTIISTSVLEVAAAAPKAIPSA